MRLRKPCEHGRYDPHPLENSAVPYPGCPGGEFLADDALVIELSEQGIREAFERLVALGMGEFHDCAKYAAEYLVTRASDGATLRCEWVRDDKT